MREFAEKAKGFVEKEFAGWHVMLLFFARAGFTEAAKAEAQRGGVQSLGLDQLAG